MTNGNPPEADIHLLWPIPHRTSETRLSLALTSDRQRNSGKRRGMSGMRMQAFSSCQPKLSLRRPLTPLSRPGVLRLGIAKIVWWQWWPWLLSIPSLPSQALLCIYMSLKISRSGMTTETTTCSPPLPGWSSVPLALTRMRQSSACLRHWFSHDKLCIAMLCWSKHFKRLQRYTACTPLREKAHGSGENVCNAST